MQTTTNDTPATDEQSDEERGLAVRTTNGAADLGVLEGEVREVDLVITDVATTLPDRMHSVEVDVLNGPAHVGDPVNVRGRRGVITAFIWKEATAKRAGRWQVLVRFDAVAGADAYERTVSANDVSILLHEVGQPPRPMPASEAAESMAAPAAAEPKVERYRIPVTSYRADFARAEDLEEIAGDLIERRGKFSDLQNQRLAFFWWSKAGKKSCETFSRVRRVSGMLAHAMPAVDAYIALSAFYARAASWTQKEVEAAVYHCLEHLVVDEKGNLAVQDHDFVGFKSEVTEYGAWNEPLRMGRSTFTQPGLFVDDGDGDEDEE